MDAGVAASGSTSALSAPAGESGTGRKRRGSRRATVQVTRLDVAVGQSIVMPSAKAPRAQPSSPAPGRPASEGPATGSAAAEDTTPGSEGAARRTAAASPGTSVPGASTPRTSTPSASRRKGIPEGILPDKAAEDLDAAWGGSTGNPERDDWLKEQRPPHWD
ncbi:hypothetical protein [Arthrobacter sp. Y-9]|uniref:hypothetical protein n=1 Tax=Arthrobacter sp. Y-9 TaxID=3039385 RepID=UPI00241D570E|nr:hypothetical protein [Arthrobacter sp. Y-9]WFR83278.1 hypothetical protein P9849_12015 [Arthrobacter sp. Y-9]